jgi:hypothetical protein
MEQTEQKDRRTYQRPELKEFGTIRELTAASSAVGSKNDAGTTGKDKSVL